MDATEAAAMLFWDALEAAAEISALCRDLVDALDATERDGAATLLLRPDLPETPAAL